MINDEVENNKGKDVRRKARELSNNIGKREDREIERRVDQSVQLQIHTGKDSIN